MRAGLHQRGFSLIEVLIAILVLALGLLGLGAVFPVVIAQQRNAVDSTMGEVVASTAEAMLVREGVEIIDLNYLWGNYDFGKENTASGSPYIYEWLAAWPSGPGFPAGDYISYPGVPLYNLQTGSIELQDVPAGNGNVQTNDAAWLRTIPVSARLFPQPYSGEDPRFVWDFVARREPSHDSVQMAVFVRRIDGRLRVPQSKTLSDVLTGNNGETQMLPLAIGTNGRPTVARPGDTVFYSMPQFLEVYVDPDKLDRLYFVDTSGATDISREFVRRVGQKLLDNVGVVRSVVDVDPDDVNAVIVDPPFRLENAGDNQTPSTDSEWSTWVRQIVYTPESPVAIRVFTAGGDS